MVYSHNLIRFNNSLDASDKMFSLVLLKVQSFTMELNGTRCFLDGMYLLCLKKDDTIKTKKNDYQFIHLCFAPKFINLNLNFELIASKEYPALCEKHQYPDFQLFLERSDEYLGIIPLSESEFELSAACFNKIDVHIKNCYTDGLWSCRSRSELFSLLNIANTALKGVQKIETDAPFLLPEILDGDEKACAVCRQVIRYIKENLQRQITIPELCKKFSTNRTTMTSTFKALTGQTPVQYILAERLKQSRLELLFTEIPINEVSKMYGIQDENYYIRAFKKQYHKTPLAFRKAGLIERINEHKFCDE